MCQSWNWDLIVDLGVKKKSVNNDDEEDVFNIG